MLKGVSSIVDFHLTPQMATYVPWFLARKAEMHTKIKTTPSTNGANQAKWLHVGERK